MRVAVLILAASLTARTAPAQTAQWDRFRGPNGSGVADDQNPPIEFGPRKNLKWKAPVPGGQSSPIVVGDKIVLTGHQGGRLITVALNRATGQQAWKADAQVTHTERFQKDAASPATATPASDGKRIVVYFGACGLICYNLQGRELWRHKLPIPEIYGDYGSGVSPIIADGLVVLVRDVATGSSILAVDAATGRRVWDVKRLSKVSWCTPVVWDVQGGKQVVSAGHGAMIGYDLKTGAAKWTVRQMPSACASSPVVADGTLYFAGWSPGAAGDSSSRQPTFDSLLTDLDKNKDGALSREETAKAFGSFFDNYDLNRDGTVTREEYDDLIKLLDEGKNGVYAVKPGGSGDITNTHMLWKRTRGMGYIPTAVLYHGQLIMVKDGGIVTALDAKTGAALYAERLGAPGEYHASPVAANGHVYFASLQGVVTVLKVGPAGAKVVLRSPRLDEKIAATPAIAGNTLYVRTNKSLYAFATK
jgi:outer membrane protein assembly factor BamB